MESKNKQIIFLVFLIVLLFVINYSFLDLFLVKFFDESEKVIVERVIDGDTVVVNGTSVRLLGINSPERNEDYYSEAKNFLEDLILNKSVVLKFGKEKYDKYNRLLAYVFVEKKNVNLELIKEGFANFYFPSGKDNYYNEFKNAWENCLENLCEKSKDKCANCVKLKEFNYKKQIVIFEDICSFNCELTNWEIKDEGRKKFIFPKFILKNKVEIKVGQGKNSENILFWERENYVWTDTGDTLFLRDNKGKLVLWESY